MIEITPYQRRLIRHACGMDSEASGYRNHFYAAPNSGDDKEWKDLVKKGFAQITREPESEWSPCRIYRATASGIFAVSVIDRSGY